MSKTCSTCKSQDEQSEYDTSTVIWTCPLSGKYSINANVGITLDMKEGDTLDLSEYLEGKRTTRTNITVEEICE